MSMTPEEEKELLQQDSKTLAVMVIANRVLGSYREEAKKCMMVLMQRKMAGDKFEFEKFIADASKEYEIKVNVNLASDMKKELMNSMTKEFVQSIKL